MPGRDKVQGVWRYISAKIQVYYSTFNFTIQHSSLLFNIQVYYSKFMFTILIFKFTIQHSSLVFNIQVYYSTFKFTIQHSSLLFNIQVYNLTTFEFLHSIFYSTCKLFIRHSSFDLNFMHECPRSRTIKMAAREHLISLIPVQNSNANCCQPGKNS